MKVNGGKVDTMFSEEVSRSNSSLPSRSNYFLSQKFIVGLDLEWRKTEKILAAQILLQAFY